MFYTISIYTVIPYAVTLLISYAPIGINNAIHLSNCRLSLVSLHSTYHLRTLQCYGAVENAAYIASSQSL